jgi:uncharacterized protein (DUF2164 family)
MTKARYEFYNFLLWTALGIVAGQLASSFYGRGLRDGSNMVFEKLGYHKAEARP